MKRLKPATVQRIKKLLPKVRTEVIQDIAGWEEYVTGTNFKSDEKAIEHLPVAFYEYLCIYKKIHVDRAWVLYCLNNFEEERLREIIPHALKRLAMLDYYLAGGKKTEKIKKPVKRRKK
jgi:hypothetical protein